jgi:hypothetical protein
MHRSLRIIFWTLFASMQWSLALARMCIPSEGNTSAANSTLTSGVPIANNTLTPVEANGTLLDEEALPDVSWEKARLEASAATEEASKAAEQAKIVADPVTTMAVHFLTREMLALVRVQKLKDPAASL